MLSADANLVYRPLSRHLRERFGEPVRRVSVDGGFTCPNVDGTVAKGGCAFCDIESFNPNRRGPRMPIREQVRHGIARLATRFPESKYLAYFQAATNTYAPLDKLRRVYAEALDHPQVVGLCVGTRPDCVPDDVVAYLAELARERYVCVELGLQSHLERSLVWMNRGHGVGEFLDAVERCAGRGFEICVHVILGLPGESASDMRDMADLVGALPIDGVKLHNLHVVRDTPLERQHRAGEVRMLEFDEYVGLACDFLERLPAHVTIHRLNGDAPPNYLVAPLWCLEKDRILRAIRTEFARRGTRQGAAHDASRGQRLIAALTARTALPLA